MLDGLQLIRLQIASGERRMSDLGAPKQKDRLVAISPKSDQVVIRFAPPTCSYKRGTHTQGEMLPRGVQ
jgi:hypothetical protein